MTGIKFKYLDWDSQQLGVQCGLIECYEGISAGRVSRRINEIIAKEKRIDFFTIKLSQGYAPVINGLVKCGGLLVHSELTLSCSRNEFRVRPLKINGYVCKFLQGIEYEPFIELAEEMRYSRFCLDKHIPRRYSVSLWKESIRNHCSGFSDKILVAFHKNKPCGIISIKFVEKSKIFLFLVGVLKQYQRRGIGKLLLNTLLTGYSKDCSIYTEVSSNNLRAIRLYQGQGLSYDGLKYILHYHREIRRSKQ